MGMACGRHAVGMRSHAHYRARAAPLWRGTSTPTSTSQAQWSSLDGQAPLTKREKGSSLGGMRKPRRLGLGLAFALGLGLELGLGSGLGLVLGGRGRARQGLPATSGSVEVGRGAHMRRKEARTGRIATVRRSGVMYAIAPVMRGAWRVCMHTQCTRSAHTATPAQVHPGPHRTWCPTA